MPWRRWERTQYIVTPYPDLNQIIVKGIPEMRVFTFCISLSFVISAVSEILLEDDVRHGEYATLPSLQKQAELRDSWTETRIKGIPGLLRKYGVDAWIVRSLRFFLAGLIFDGGESLGLP